jgi:hypothetical protein
VFAKEENASQVNIYNALVFIPADLIQGAYQYDPGIVVKHIDAAMDLHYFFYGGGDIIFACDIAWQEGAVSASGINLIPDFIAALGDIQQDNCISFT